MKTVSEATLRRYYSNITVSGFGLMLYGVWSVLKASMKFFFGTNELFDVVDMSPEEAEIYLIMVYVVIALVGLFILFIHLYSGINAVKFGRRHSTKKTFLIFPSIIFVITLFDLPFYLSYAREETLDVTIASLAVELTLLVMLFDMIISTIRVSQIVKKGQVL